MNDQDKKNFAGSLRQRFRYEDPTTLGTPGALAKAKKLESGNTRNKTDNPKNKPYLERAENQGKISQLSELDFFYESNRVKASICDVPVRQDIPSMIQAKSVTDLLDQLTVKVCRLVEGSSQPEDIQEVRMIEKALTTGPNPLSKAQFERLMHFIARKASNKKPVSFTTSVPPSLIKLSAVGSKLLSIKERLQMTRKKGPTKDDVKYDVKDDIKDKLVSESAIKVLSDDLANNMYNVAYAGQQKADSNDYSYSRLKTIKSGGESQIKQAIPFSLQSLCLVPASLDAPLSLSFMLDIDVIDTKRKSINKNRQLYLDSVAVLNDTNLTFKTLRSLLIEPSTLEMAYKAIIKNAVSSASYKLLTILRQWPRTAEASSELRSAVELERNIENKKRASPSGKVLNPVRIDTTAGVIKVLYAQFIKQTVERLLATADAQTIVFIFKSIKADEKLILFKLIPATRISKQQLQHSLSDYLAPQKKLGAKRTSSKTIQSLPRDLIDSTAIPLSYLPALTRPGKKGKRRGRRLLPL